MSFFVCPPSRTGPAAANGLGGGKIIVCYPLHGLEYMHMAWIRRHEGAGPHTYEREDTPQLEILEKWFLEYDESLIKLFR